MGRSPGKTATLPQWVRATRFQGTSCMSTQLRHFRHQPPHRLRYPLPDHELRQVRVQLNKCGMIGAPSIAGA